MIAIMVSAEDKNDAMSYIPSATVVESRAFDGAQIVTLMVAALTAILPSLAKMIIVYYNAKKEIRIKFKGIEIKGLNKNNALEVLEKYMELEAKCKETEQAVDSDDEKQ